MSARFRDFVLFCHRMPDKCDQRPNPKSKRSMVKLFRIRNVRLNQSPPLLQQPRQPPPPNRLIAVDASVPSLGLTTATRANMGAQITEVTSGGVAERAYLHVGDVINAVDGRPVKTTMELAAALSNRTPGSKIRIGYMLSTGLGYFTKEVIVIPAQNR